MLIDDDRIEKYEYYLEYLATLPKSQPHPQTGVYEILGFNGGNSLRDFERYPRDLSIGPYGVCDNVEQVLEQCPELITSDRQFLITLTRVTKSEQEEGGWRWHKWGAYIGTQNPQCEYLIDEPDIEEVFCYHIYEKTGV